MSLATLEFSNRRHRQQLVVRSTDEIGAARVAVKAVLTTQKEVDWNFRVPKFLVLFASKSTARTTKEKYKTTGQG